MRTDIIITPVIHIRKSMVFKPPENWLLMETEKSFTWFNKIFCVLLVSSDSVSVPELSPESVWKKCNHEKSCEPWICTGKNGTASSKNKRKQRWYCVAADKYFFRSFFVPIITSVKIHMKILLIKKWMIQLLIENLLFLMFW